MAQKKNRSLSALFKQIVSGLPFPVSREDVVRYVRFWGGGDGILDLTHQLARQTYQNKSQLINEIEF
jgi:hypothetical protein